MPSIVFAPLDWFEHSEDAIEVENGRKNASFWEIDQEIEISAIDSGAEAAKTPLVEVLPTVNMSFVLTYDNIILKVKRRAVSILCKWRLGPLPSVFEF